MKSTKKAHRSRAAAGVPEPVLREMNGTGTYTFFTPAETPRRDTRPGRSSSLGDSIGEVDERWPIDREGGKQGLEAQGESRKGMRVSPSPLAVSI